jgi:hypothetical protein
MMRRCTGFDANNARWQLLEERDDILAFDLAANEYVPAASTPFPPEASRTPAARACGTFLQRQVSKKP